MAYVGNIVKKNLKVNIVFKTPTKLKKKIRTEDWNYEFRLLTYFAVMIVIIATLVKVEEKLRLGLQNI